MREVTPRSVAQVPQGSRVCAFWSNKYKHLFPGVIGDPDLVDRKLDPAEYVNIELDDGDSRDIPIKDVRCLPNDFPFKGNDFSTEIEKEIYCSLFLI